MRGPTFRFVMRGPTNSENPAIFWFYRIVGFGAVIGAVAMSRRPESFSGMGTIPPPPRGDLYTEWLRKTLPAGTRIRFRHDFLTRQERDWSGRGVGSRELIPSGTIARVVAAWPANGYSPAIVAIRWEETTQLFTSSTSETKNGHIELDPGEDLPFDVLDDHWGPLVVAPKKASPPPTQGWAKQLRASRSNRARRP